MFEKWMNKPEHYLREDKGIVITAGPKTDFFEDPLSDFSVSNAPVLYNEISGNFTFSCHISPKFGTTYDAGALIVYAGPENWIKLAFENTDLGYPSAVCVVTSGKSDDCNGERIETASVFLKISRKGDVFGTFFSENGKKWKMVRLFTCPVGEVETVRLGLSAQSPLGSLCEVRFDSFRFSQRPVDNFRKGE